MRQTIERLFSLFDRQTRLGMAGLGGLILVATLLEMTGIGLFLPLLQAIADPAALAVMPVFGYLATAVAGGQADHFILLGCLVLFAFFAVKNLTLGLIVYAQNRFVQDRMAAFSQALLAFYLGRPYIFHLGRNSADLMRNVKLVVPRVFAKGVMAVLQLATEALTACGILAVLLWVEPRATAAVVALLGGSLAIYYVAVRKPLRRWGKRAMVSDGRLLLWINQSLGSVKATKLSGRESFFCDAFGVQAREKAHYDTLTGTLPNVPRLLIETMAVGGMLLAVVVVLLSGAALAQALPTLGLFAVAAVRLMPSLSRLMTNLTLLKEGAAAIDAVYEDLRGVAVDGGPGAAAAFFAAPGPAVSRPFRSELRLEAVHYTYPGSESPALQGVDLVVAHGESIALVGASGSGKTTLVDVMLGLLEPVGGRVLVDGADMRADPRGWQSHVGYVPQHIYLTDDTLRRNIALGVPDAEIDGDRLAAAVRMAHLGAMVAALPRGLETPVGENGTWLSGGQRQRVGIARALYDDPDVLVLDEATSALDNETEHEIAQAVRELSGRKTVILIAHRLSTVRGCDRLYFLDDGRIADSGTFDELAARNPAFRRMAQIDSTAGPLPGGGKTPT